MLVHDGGELQVIPGDAQDAAEVEVLVVSADDEGVAAPGERRERGGVA